MDPERAAAHAAVFALVCRSRAGVKTEKNSKKYVFLGFSLAFLVFSLFFLGFSLDFCKGRISKNTLQISLKSSQILPLSIFSVSTPARFDD